MPCFPRSRLLTMSYTVVLLSALLSSGSLLEAEESRPTIEISLVSKYIYVGENPSIKIVITAPKNGVVDAIKPDRVYERAVLWLDLLTIERTTVPASKRSYRPTRKPDDFVRLDSGKSIEMSFSLFDGVRKAGRYIVRVSFFPTPDEKFEVKQELPITCLEISDNRVYEKVLLKIPPNPNANLPRDEFLDLLNVKTDNGFEMLYRQFDYGDDGAPRYRLERLFPLDEKSRFTAVPMFFEKKDQVRQIWITYNKGGELHFARIMYSSGQVLENTPLKEMVRFPEKMEPGK